MVHTCITAFFKTISFIEWYFFSVSEVHCSYVYKPYITYVYTEIYTISVHVTTHYPYPSPSPGEKNSVFINISLELINFYTEDKFPFHFITSHFLEMAFHWQPLPSVNSFFFFGYAIIWHIHKTFFISYSPSNVFWISYDLEIINQ